MIVNGGCSLASALGGMTITATFIARRSSQNGVGYCSHSQTLLSRSDSHKRGSQHTRFGRLCRRRGAWRYVQSCQMRHFRNSLMLPRRTSVALPCSSKANTTHAIMLLGSICKRSFADLLEKSLQAPAKRVNLKKLVVTSNRKLAVPYPFNKTENQ
jgi:hypothetical protein